MWNTLRRWLWGSRARGGLAFFVLAAASLWPGAPAQAQPQCATTGTDQTCIHSIFLSGGPVGLRDFATLTLTNTTTGTILGTGVVGIGVQANAATVTNYGTILGTGPFNGLGILAPTATVTNYGTISGSGGNLGI